jgi:hypothetical protein
LAARRFVLAARASADNRRAKAVPLAARRISGSPVPDEAGLGHRAAAARLRAQVHDHLHPPETGEIAWKVVIAR